MLDGVLSHPAHHGYVHNAIGEPQARSGVDVWDVPALSAAGIRVVHLHFGFETRSCRQLGEWITDLRKARIAIVHTVHDLDNPHLHDQTEFHRLVGALVCSADIVLTLTDTAAATIRARYGRTAQVVPHPHVVPLAEVERRGAAARPERRGIYVHAATVRPNLDLDLLERIAIVAGCLGGLRIHVRETASQAEIAQLAALSAHPQVEVEVSSRLDDDELWDRLSAARLIVLPYRWGTHSGLLEAAHDLATPVAAPPIGGYVDQGAHPLGSSDLRHDLMCAAALPPTVTAAARRTQARDVIEFHRECYERLAGSSRW